MATAGQHDAEAVLVRGARWLADVCDWTGVQLQSEFSLLWATKTREPLNFSCSLQITL
jgi:hypothetical protein